ncbi:hypothetical protein ACWGLF_11525 [Streptomyces puniciscabiei]
MEPRPLALRLQDRAAHYAGPGQVEVHREAARRAVAALAKSDDATPGPTVTSPNGTYIASGSVVFDVKTGKGLCLAGDTANRTLQVASLADDGTAHAVNDIYDGIDGTTEISSMPAAELNVRTGSRTASATRNLHVHIMQVRFIVVRR